MVLRTLIKNQACARRRTGARRRCLPRARGWTALPAPSPAGQLLAPTREPASPAAPERSRAPARSPWAARAPRLGPPPHFLSRLHAPSRSLLRGRLRDPSLCGRFPSQTPPGLPTARTSPPPQLTGTCQARLTSPRRRAPLASEPGAAASGRQFRVCTGGARTTPTRWRRGRPRGPGPYHSQPGEAAHRGSAGRKAATHTPIAVGVGTRWEALG